MAVQKNVFILTLKQQVIFPAIRTSISIPPETFEEVCEFCEKYDSTHIGVVAEKQDSKDDEQQLFSVGTYCKIASHSQSTNKLGDQEITVVTLSIEGQSRFQVKKYTSSSPHRLATIQLLDEKGAGAITAEVKALVHNTQQLVTELLKDDSSGDGAAGSKANNTGGSLKNLFGSSKQRIRWPSSPSVLADMIGAGLPQLSVGERQQVLETNVVKLRLELVCELVRKAVEVQKLSREINDKIQKRTEDELRETVLKRQLQQLKGEMRKLKGHDDDEDSDEEEEEDDIGALREALIKSGLPPAAKKIAARELKRLQGIQPQHPEYTVCRTYLETLSNLPWNVSTQDELDLAAAKGILEHDHYGLEKVKRRILEFLAVQKMRGDMKGPILCLHGPPGVGKTSLGRSIARSLGRKFHRISLGGVRDEAELRGHRRTYIGSMPGSIMQALVSLKTKNPVILLDEVDKITSNSMYNPSGALLELLDPEQNHLFKDHYINTPFDLSNVLFLCTCNDLAPIDRPLLDRMEVIDLSGYTVEEKFHIASTHLLPKQRKLHALEKPDPEDSEKDAEEADVVATAPALSEEEKQDVDEEIVELQELEEVDEQEPVLPFPDEPVLLLTKVAITDLISKYTMESGVRSLERRLAQICRWATLRLAFGDSAVSVRSEEINEAERLALAALAQCGPDQDGKMLVDAHHLPHIIGAELFEPDLAERLTVGVAMGLAVSSVGGSLLFIEASRNKGSGGLTITGQLGEVMRESVTTAMSLLRSKLYTNASVVGAGDKAAGESHQVASSSSSSSTVANDAVLQLLSAIASENGNKDPFGRDDIHVHFPAGGIPKDGPSAGVATTLALASLLLGRPVRSDTAVTGEISLRGHVLPVGGIRDKVLAAHRAGVKHVLLPFANQRHVKDEMPASAMSEITIHFVKHIDEALAWAFADHEKDPARKWPLPLTGSAPAPTPTFALMAKL